MDRLKQSVIAKIIAWILCVTSVLGAVKYRLFDKSISES